MAQKGSYLVSGKYLEGDDFLVSPNAQYIAYMQDDGNFVLYYASGSQPPSPDWTRPYWDIGKAPGAPGVAIMQSNGNFTICSGNDPTVDPDLAYWDTGTTLGDGQYILVLQDDGNLVLSYGSDPAQTSEICWSALPEIFVQCKFMQNYRVTSPVNGGKEVVVVRNADGNIELFTIGSDKEVHTFSPDLSSETGYSEAVLTKGAAATGLGAGLNNKGHVVLFVAATLTLSYMVETSDPSGSWSTLAQVNAFPAFSKAKNISDIVVEEIAGNLYVAATVTTTDNQFYVAYAGAQGDYVTFHAGPFATPIAPRCFFQGNADANAALGFFLPEKLCLYVIATQHALTGLISSSLNPLSVGTALDDAGVNHTLAILEDHSAYLLRSEAPDASGNPQYSWLPLWQPDPNLNDAPILYQEVVVEADTHGAVQVFTVSQPTVIVETSPNPYNFLYHWTPDSSSATGYVERPLPIHKSDGLQLGGVGNNQGSVDIFAVDSANLVTHLFLEQASGNWAEQNILDPANEDQDIMEYASYATDITLYDGVRAVRPNEEAHIWASDETRLTINGLTYFIDAQRMARVYSNDSGILSIAQETDSLASPFLQISLPSLSSDKVPLIVIQPFVDVQTQLDKVDSTVLMNATTMDSEGVTTPLLDDDYRTPDNTASMASAINNFMDDVETPTLSLSSSKANRRHRFWSRSPLPASELGRLIKHHHGKAWQLTFEGKKVSYKDLTAEEAARIRAEKLATLPSVGSSSGSWWSKIGDALNAVVDGIAKLWEITYHGLQATIDLIINGVHYILDATIEFLEDAFDMIQLIFANVLVFFENLYKWLAWLFIWKYIRRTKTALSYTIGQMLGFLQGSAAGLQTLVDNGFDTLKDQVGSLFDQAIENIAGQSSVGGYEQSNAEPNKDYDEASSNNFFFNEFVNNSGSSAALSAPFQELATSDPMSDFMNQLNKLASTIEGNSAFGDAVSYFQNMGGSPDQIFKMLLGGMLSVIKGIVLVGIDLVQALIDSLLQLLQSLIASIQSILTQQWNIPFVSRFYKWLTGDPLTTLDLVSLILAIPTTIFYRIINGSFPFLNDSGSGSTDDITKAFSSTTMLQAAGLIPSSSLTDTPAITLSPLAAEILADGYLMCTFCGGCLTAINDTVSPPAQATGWRAYVSYLLTIGTLGCQFPWFFSQGDLDCLTQVGIEYWIYIGACLELALAVYYNNYGLATPGFSNDTMAISLSVCGGLSLAMAAWAAVGDTDNRKKAWRVISPIPMMCKFLRLTAISTGTGYISLVALGVIDYVCNTTAAVLGYLILREGN